MVAYGDSPSSSETPAPTTLSNELSDQSCLVSYARVFPPSSCLGKAEERHPVFYFGVREDTSRFCNNNFPWSFFFAAQKMNKDPATLNRWGLGFTSSIASQPICKHQPRWHGKKLVLSRVFCIQHTSWHFFFDMDTFFAVKRLTLKASTNSASFGESQHVHTVQSSYWCIAFDKVASRRILPTLREAKKESASLGGGVEVVEHISGSSCFGAIFEPLRLSKRGCRTTNLVLIPGWHSCV